MVTKRKLNKAANQSHSKKEEIALVSQINIRTTLCNAFAIIKQKDP